jgi:hypothetical protein
VPVLEPGLRFQPRSTRTGEESATSPVAVFDTSVRSRSGNQPGKRQRAFRKGSQRKQVIASWQGSYGPGTRHERGGAPPGPMSQWTGESSTGQDHIRSTSYLDRAWNLIVWGDSSSLAFPCLITGTGFFRKVSLYLDQGLGLLFGGFSHRCGCLVSSRPNHPRVHLKKTQRSPGSVGRKQEPPHWAALLWPAYC